MAERQQVIDRVKARLMDGSLSQDQARKVLQALPKQAAPQPAPPATPEPFSAMEQEGQPQEQSLVGMAGKAMSGIGEMFSGAQRTGTDIERTPSLFNSDFLADLPADEQAKIVGLAQITADPNEMAEMIKAQVPDTEIQYNKDEQGNVYPVLRRADGRVAMVDKPGFDILNASQLAADVAMFTPAGRSVSAVRGIGGAALTESARQGVQSGAGGEFDEVDVALSGGIEGVGRGAARGFGAAYRGMTGTPTEEVSDVIRAGGQYDVPVATSDVIPPKTAAGRAGQVMSETVPLVGTGGMRASQQAAREQAVDQFVDRFQGGSYAQIIQSLKSQRDKIKTAAGKTYDRLAPKLNSASEQSGGIGFSNTESAIENALDTLTVPGRKSSDRAADLLADIQETITGPGQTFQNVKSNLGAWSEAIDSIDPAIRSQMTSQDKAQIQSVLKAMRKDRDAFAESVLSPNEYRQLKNADQAYGEMAQTMKKTRIKNVLDKGDMTPEVAKSLLFSNKPSEVNQLYQGLTNEGRSNARATIITDISQRLSNRASGLTPDALATELSKRREVLDVFFRGNRRKELNGFLRLMDATRRAQKADSTFGVATGQQAIPYIVGAGAVVEPGVAVAFGTVGALGRLYESPRVRGILARMGSVEPGSTQFEQLLKQYRQEAARVAQSLKDEQIPENLTSDEAAQ